jgi:serine/threonine protein kinase
MVDPQASQFWRFAVKSGLLDDEAVQACWEKIPEDKRTADAVDRRLARQAVNAGLLTVWQAQQLLTGRATGFKIDRYLLLDLIGQGGMGRVYLAKDTRLGRRVAIKVLSNARMSNPRAIARFQREAKVGAQLQHENLVRIYDQGESSGTHYLVIIHYLVMEYIEGRNVAQIIGERGSIAWPEAARLARQIALGLEHAQQKGLIHRDVNPANILVTREGVAKLADLGLAIDLAEEANVTRDGATVGTFDYISPEQARHSREVDTRADIYSLGCTLYHMLSGRVPFPMPSLPEKLYAHQLHDAEPPTAPEGELPEGLVEVVRRMMRKRPEERYQTPVEVAQALEPFAEPAPGFSGSSASSSGLRSSPPASPSITPAIEIPAAAAMTPSPAVAEASLLIGSGSDPEGALFDLDIGPEVPLSASLSPAAKPRAKPKPKDDPKPEAPAAPPKPRREVALSPRARKLAPVAIGLLVVVAAVAGIAAVVAASRKKLENRPIAGEEPDEPVASATENPGGPGKPSGPISVSVGGPLRPVATLAEAIAIAGGGQGEVVLSGPGPIRVSSAQEIRHSRGRVVIRAAEGPAPVVVVDMVGGKPWLLTLPNASVRLKGLRIVAHYQATADPTPLIEASGPVALERCTFVAAGASGNSRGVKLEGPKLSVDGCLFAGFDRALDITAFPGLDATVTQSILAHSAETDRSPGWAIRVAFGGGRENKPRKLALDHVTARGGGLLEVVDFPVSSPLTVSLDHVAVQAPALLAWTPRAGESAEGWTKGLKWLGKGDLYDITGSAWVVVSASGELPTPNAPRDLAGWTAAIGSDKDSAARSFKLAASAADIATEITAVEPGQFALQGDGTGGVGADPNRVGPAGGSAPKAAEPKKEDEAAKKESS